MSGGNISLHACKCVNSDEYGADFGVDGVLYWLIGRAKVFVRLMVDVAQLVEHLVVIQDVAGSSPVVHPFSMRDKRPAGPLIFWV